MINITAQDSDTVTFEVVNKPDSAIVNQSGKVLRFKWPVASSREVGLLTLLLAVIFVVLRSRLKLIHTWGISKCLWCLDLSLLNFFFPENYASQKSWP